MNIVFMIVCGVLGMLGSFAFGIYIGFDVYEQRLKQLTKEPTGELRKSQSHALGPRPKASQETS